MCPCTRATKSRAWTRVRSAVPGSVAHEAALGRWWRWLKWDGDLQKLSHLPSPFNVALRREAGLCGFDNRAKRKATKRKENSGAVRK